MGGIIMTEYEDYLLDKLHKLKEENHSLEVELVNTKKLVMKESSELANLRKINHELSEYINFLNSKDGELRIAYDLIERKNSCLQRQNEKLEELRHENEELKLKVEEYYESWQDELMQRDDYEDI